jgi:hypothetical protein
MTAEELAQLGYRPSIGSADLNAAQASVSPQDLQQFYVAAGNAAAPEMPVAGPRPQFDPAILTQLMGSTPSADQQNQVNANQIAMMGGNEILPPSDPNNITSGLFQVADASNGGTVIVPPNTGTPKTYGGTASPEAQQSESGVQTQPESINKNVATALGFPQFSDWAKASGLPRQVMPDERKVILEKYLDQQKDFMARQDPEKLLQLQKTQGEIAAQGRAASTADQELVDKAFKMDESLADVQNKIDFLDKLKSHPGLSPMVGSKGISTGFMGIAIPGTDAANFNADLKRVQGQNFLAAFNQLKGAGQITEIEGAKATQAISSLSTAQSEDEFKKSIDELQGLLRTGMERTQKHLSAMPAAAKAVVQTPAGTTTGTSPAHASVSRPAMLNLKGVVYQIGADGTYHRVR